MYIAFRGYDGSDPTPFSTPDSAIMGMFYASMGLYFNSINIYISKMYSYSNISMLYYSILAVIIIYDTMLVWVCNLTQHPYHIYTVY